MEYLNDKTEDKFFKECESLVDVKRFNNLIKWLDRKGISEIERYKEEQQTLFRLDIVK